MWGYKINGWGIRRVKKSTRDRISVRIQYGTVTSCIIFVMSDHQDTQKNMIRCQAKIRNSQSGLGTTNPLSDGFLKKVIRIKNYQPIQSPYPPTDPTPFSPPKPTPWQQLSTSFISSKLISQDLESTKPFSKLNLQDSWMRTQNEETVSMICRQQFTKRLECTDFHDFQRNIIPLMDGDCDSSFEESRILGSCQFQGTERKGRECWRESGFQKVLEQKNTEMINILVSKNEEKKVLEKRIFDLEFEMFIQKRESESNLNAVAVCLKNAEAVGETLGIEVERLTQELELSQQMRGRSEERILCLEDAVHALEMRCHQLVCELQARDETIEVMRRDHQLLQLRVNQQALDPEICTGGIQSLQDQLFHADLPLGFQEIEGLDASWEGADSREEHHEGNASEESVSSHTSYLQSLIKQYQDQLLEKKKKIREQRKIIADLENKLQHLQGASASLNIVNDVLCSMNEQMVSSRLKSLNLQFQCDGF